MGGTDAQDNSAARNHRHGDLLNRTHLDSILSQHAGAVYELQVVDRALKGDRLTNASGSAKYGPKLPFVARTSI